MVPRISREFKKIDLNAAGKFIGHACSALKCSVISSRVHLLFLSPAPITEINFNIVNTAFAMC